jgi:hypothetical protein
MRFLADPIEFALNYGSKNKLAPLPNLHSLSSRQIPPERMSLRIEHPLF